MSIAATEDLAREYAVRIRPLLPQAKRAYGARSQNTPAHVASREYTRLLVEYYDRGGSLTQLAKELEVAYAGLRRRVVMRDVEVSSIRPKARGSMEGVPEAAARILAAKSIGVDAYHDQLAEEYQSGISLAGIARELGLSSSAPLYYGVQRSLQRHGKTTADAAFRVAPPTPAPETPASSGPITEPALSVVKTEYLQEEQEVFEPGE